MVELLRYPTEADWAEVKRRALVTVGKTAITAPTLEWKRRILKARHSPIRYLQFSFYLKDIPYFASTHLVRHVHAQPYVKSQRNDRQSEYDRNAARQDAPVDMIFDVNADELMTVASKRLYSKADPTTSGIVREMVTLVEPVCPEFKGLLVPPCVWQGGNCYEFNSCRRGHNEAG